MGLFQLGTGIFPGHHIGGFLGNRGGCLASSLLDHLPGFLPGKVGQGPREYGVAIRFAGAPVWMLGYIFLSGAVVIAGVGLSIHAIRAALRKYRSQMVWLILGLMAGSLYAIVMGPAGLDAPQPPVSFETFDLPGFALGVAILLGLELLRKWTAQHPVRFMEKNA